MIIPILVATIASLGLGLILSDLLRVPSFAVSKSTHNLGKRQNKKTNPIELWLKEIAGTLAGKLKIKLLIPKTALSSYKEALCSTEGEYAEVSANTPEGFPPEYALIPSIVEPTNMLGKSMLSGVKDFSKYDKP